MRCLIGGAVAALLATSAAGCGTGVGEPGAGKATPHRALLSLEHQPPAEAGQPEAAMADLPDVMTLEEGASRLVTIDGDQVTTPQAAEGRSAQQYRLGYFGRRRYWNWGYAPYWGSAWRAYSYLPVGNYYFPYYAADGRYLRYRSDLSPYFYRWGGSFWPYYAGYRWF
ncbi:MAG: hypothetical protein VKQ33_04090 [Candidatus Sericytochromatia bacterium]|nr:hypothetical protein [Candidatus Sericytochromatia bacterium]